MAGDWIKMRSDLFTHPKVVRIASALKADKLRTVGGLMSVWCLFDAHSADGTLDGYSGETLDDHLSWPGFSAAMSAVGWLSIGTESLTLPEFETHNGASAKRRAQDADRKKAVRKTSASDADKMRTREEKRREEQDQELGPKAAPSDRPAEDIAKAKADRAERLAAVTEDAIETFNAAAFTVAHGGRIPNVTKVNREKRRQQVGRSINVIREICAEEFGAPEINRQFWTGYWKIVNADAFASGRQAGTGAHSNWAPSFEYLTRPDTITALYERAEAAA